MAFFSNFFNRNKSTIPDQDIQKINNTTEAFNSVDQNIEAIVASRSVVNTAIEHENSISMFPNYMSITESLNALPIITNKFDRIRNYRTIAAFQHCNFCIEEIANDFIHEDEVGRFILLNIKPTTNNNLTETKRDVIQNEFEKYMSLFKLKEDGFNLIKRFIVEGELAWENIINPDYPDLGIIGVKFLPTEYYETLIDPNTGSKIGICFDVKKMQMDLKNLVSMTYYGSQRIFNSLVTGSEFSSINRENCIPLLWPQVTYICSDNTSSDGTICFPMIEKCKQSYYQLAMMQDSALILRITHAPERLLFNIDTSKMSDKVAYETLQNFGNQLRKKTVLDKHSGKETPGITNVYNPSTMLDAWIFGKGEGRERTTVESVGSNVTYDQIDDIKYFLKVLFKSFTVPFSRFESPETVNQSNEQISYEEYAFSRMIINLQRRFALGFKRGFITHLKLRGIWQKYKLKEADLDISFVKPVLFDLFEIQQMTEIKLKTYANYADRDEFSKIIAMKNVLKMTDAEIEENFKNLAKENQYIKLAGWYGSQIESNGPKTPEFDIPVKGEEGEEEQSPEAGGENNEEESSEENNEEESSNEESSEENNEEESSNEESSEEETPTKTPEGFGIG